MPDVRDKGSTASIEISTAGFIPQVAPFAPNDLGEIAGQLPVEDVAVWIAMRGSDLRFLGGRKANLSRRHTRKQGQLCRNYI
ncbi:MAG: hypothetical protein ABI884_01235 [Gemmatimonadota bacterium]